MLSDHPILWLRKLRPKNVCNLTNYLDSQSRAVQNIHIDAHTCTEISLHINTYTDTDKDTSISTDIHVHTSAPFLYEVMFSAYA